MRDTAGCDRNVEKLFSSGRPGNDRVIMDLLRYWESLRAGRIVPARSEIDPRQIKTALKHTFILEFDPVGGIRFRLAGEKICALMGMELRGMPAYSLIDIADRRDFEQALRDMAQNPEIVEFRLMASTGNRSRATARMLLLPMRDAFGEITRILGGLSIRTPVFDPPLRFELVEKMKTRIVAGTGCKSLPSDHGFAEDAASFTLREPAQGDIPAPDDAATGKPSAPVVPYLRIVSDNYGR